MYKNCINGKYNGKEEYYSDTEEIEKDLEQEQNEDKKAIRNLSPQEQELINIILKAKEETIRILNEIKSRYSDKKDILIMIPKTILRNKTDIETLYKYYNNNNIKELKDYVASIYLFNKLIRTNKDFENKIIDDTVFTYINSNI